MNLPKDPIMLLSVVNTQLRDHYSSLEAFAEDTELSASDIMEKLAAVNYFYDDEQNQFR